MAKKMTKKTLTRKTVIQFLIIILLLGTNIFTYYKYKTKSNPACELCLTEIEDTEGKFNADKKYYKEIGFSEFKKLYSSKDIATIAVTDNASTTHEKFIEYINKKAYYEKANINLIELSKLSKKNEVAFYDLDERLSKLDSDYIIVVRNNTILEITQISREDLNNLIEMYNKKGE